MSFYCHHSFDKGVFTLSKSIIGFTILGVGVKGKEQVIGELDAPKIENVGGSGGFFVKKWMIKDWVERERERERERENIFSKVNSVGLKQCSFRILKQHHPDFSCI